MSPIQEADYYYNSEPQSWKLVTPYKVVYSMSNDEISLERADQSNWLLCEIAVTGENQVLVREKHRRVLHSGAVVYDQYTHKLKNEEINTYFAPQNMIPSNKGGSYFKAIRWVQKEDPSDYNLPNKGRYFGKQFWNWLKEGAVSFYQMRKGNFKP